MHQLEEYLRVADELMERARRFSPGVGYEAGVRDTLEAIAPLLRTLVGTARREADSSLDQAEAGFELRRIAAQLEISVIQVGHLLRRLRARPDRPPLDLQALDAAARLLMDVALRIDTLSAGPPPDDIGGLTKRRDDVNYLAALALALARAGNVDEDRLVEQLRDLADHQAEPLIDAAVRLAHEHDPSELAAARAIGLLERAAGPDLSA
ncbi:MAG TPA: hypothetical protein VK906_00880 [Egicoccus sp.]|nr:hypothetical protein [Egicoccus sp.]HSK21692.1 hypothetical protein [Egicoccus sp.]